MDFPSNDKLKILQLHITQSSSVDSDSRPSSRSNKSMTTFLSDSNHSNNSTNRRRSSTESSLFSTPPSPENTGKTIVSARVDNMKYFDIDNVGKFVVKHYP